MAVSSGTAREHAPTGPDGPIRTCIGCRTRAAATELLRVVAASGGAVTAVLPDPRHRAAGRGAWVHRSTGCVELAERRRAFGRALRIAGPLDVTAVRAYVEALTAPERQQESSDEPGFTMKSQQ